MKRILPLAGLALWAVLIFTSNRNARLVASAGDLEDPGVKIRLLAAAEATADVAGG